MNQKDSIRTKKSGKNQRKNKQEPEKNRRDEKELEGN
jgi:hypothetical protein